jgi:molecular chaperone GrpE
MEKQRAETYINATVDIVTRLLPVLDDFGRALNEIPQELVEHSWVEGMKLVHRKLSNIVEGLNVTPIKAVGEPFDPNFHEAIMKESSEEHESGVITRELQTGYQMGERVIRPTLVYVAE